jgi:hypothetical protein
MKKAFNKRHSIKRLKKRYKRRSQTKKYRKGGRKYLQEQMTTKAENNTQPLITVPPAMDVVGQQITIEQLKRELINLIDRSEFWNRDDWIEYNNNDGDIIAFRYIGRGIPKPITRDWMGRKTPQKYDMPNSQQLNEINRYLDHYRLKAELRNIGGIGTIMVVRRMI